MFWCEKKGLNDVVDLFFKLIRHEDKSATEKKRAYPQAYTEGEYLFPDCG